MIKFLCDSSSIDIASIIVSGFLSIVIIVVSIVTSWFNYRIQKDIAKVNQVSAEISKKAATLPLKIEIVDNLVEFDSDFYHICTKLIINTSPSEELISDTKIKFDEMLSKLYAIKLKAKAVFVNEDMVLKNIETLYVESEKLYVNLLGCKDVIRQDLINAYLTRETLQQLKNCNRIVGDILDNEGNFSLFTYQMDQKSIEFIKQFLVVFHLLDQFDFKDMMSRFVSM